MSTKNSVRQSEKKITRRWLYYLTGLLLINFGVGIAMLIKKDSLPKGMEGLGINIIYHFVFRFIIFFIAVLDVVSIAGFTIYLFNINKISKK